MDDTPHDGPGPQLPALADRIAAEADALRARWRDDPRFAGIERRYEAEEVIALRGSVRVEHSLARQGSERLWSLLHERPYVNALGAMTGGQAVQMVRAGLEAIYLSGWQVAADANLGEQVYPDQSLYPANSVPAVVRRISNALRRADQIEFSEGRSRSALDGADRRRRRGGLRRTAERVRADARA